MPIAFRTLMGIARAIPSRFLTSSMGPQEVHLSVPWGTVAGLHWQGEGDNVLAIHGWLDNANSFVPLFHIDEASDSIYDDRSKRHGLQQNENANLLLLNLNVIAIDLPGHGRSDHKPPGSSYLAVDWVRDVHLIIKSLGWDKMHLVGHSMGAGICSLFAGCFPEKILSLTLLEGAVPVQSQDATICDSLRQSILSWEVLEKKKQEPTSFTFSDALNRLLRANAHLTEASARLLLERGLKQVQDTDAEEDHIKAMDTIEPVDSLSPINILDTSNRKNAEIAVSVSSQSSPEQKFAFSRDLAVRQYSAIRLNFNQVQAFMKQIRCPVCFVMAEDGIKYQIEHTRKHLVVLSRHCSHFERHLVEGGHHVHINAPERVRPIWLHFLHKVIAGVGSLPKQKSNLLSKL